MRTEKVLAVLICLGFIGKIFHIPGGSFLTVLGLLILAFFYWPLGFYFLSYKSIKNNVVMSVLSGLAFAPVILGTLFRIMHWPGTATLLALGLVFTCPVLIVALMKHSKSEDADSKIYFRNILCRSVPIFVLGVLFLFVRV